MPAQGRQLVVTVLLLLFHLAHARLHGSQGTLLARIAARHHPFAETLEVGPHRLGFPGALLLGLLYGFLDLLLNTGNPG